ncbi:hypothetical protein HHK36_008686 [Tetracentron sinense]|uniref:Kinesin motor domain-containing protein n=1 Tax=Tetracentron sinense TaxID=13715 RepID=A0A834ZJZ2_TETSI|nr:hypothetical protein HHK36_008686 [Tetracentron sinense]
MEPKTTPKCPQTVTIRRNPPRKAKATPSASAAAIPFSSSSSSAIKDIPSFPLEEILSIDVPQIPPLDLSKPSKDDEGCETLRIFLRIRPLKPNQSAKKKSNGVHGTRPRSKRASPQTEANKNTKKNGSFLAVNDSRSVTLTPPSALQDPKRIKTETYDGFTHVFSPDSSQSEVYEKMMDSLVEDFIRGKSGMLVALGPTGSGKTHTVFGSPREPGMVPLALRRIFSWTDESGSELPRYFYLSMFEIYAERGKGERIYDLSPNGADLCLQQSTVKGLQEVMVSDVAQAESLIARGMLKRVTAMTNANSQSSRSQCIINIRSAPNMIYEEVEVPPNNAVLTIVDLAGAEREKRTGNQCFDAIATKLVISSAGSKIVRKQFHQQHIDGVQSMPKREEDYLDTSFLLRQALPFMKIKFNNVEELSSLPCQKRLIHTLRRIEQPKRRKFSDLDAVINEGMGAREEQQIREKEADVVSEKLHELEPLKVSITCPKVIKSESKESALLKEEYCIDMAKNERNGQIMRDFSKAIWNALKQYKRKLEVSENEVHCLKEILTKEKTRYLELEQEMKDFKICCSCCQQISKEESSLKMGTITDSCSTGSPQPGGHGSNIVHEASMDPYYPNLRASDCKRDLKICNATVGQSQDISLQMESSDVVDTPSLCIEDFKEQNCQVNVDSCSPNLNGYECNNNLRECVESSDVVDTPPLCIEDFKEQNSQVNVDSWSPNLNGYECNNNLRECAVTTRQSQEIFLQCINQKRESFPGKKNLGVVDNSSNADVTAIGSGHSESMVSSSQSHVLVRDEDCLLMEGNKLDCEEEKKLLEPPLTEEDVTCINGCSINNVHRREPNLNSSSKPLNAEKPKRRLLPASSILLKETSGLDLEEQNEKPKTWHILLSVTFVDGSEWCITCQIAVFFE